MRFRSISVMAMLVLGAGMATAQQRGARPQPGPRFVAPGQQRQAPPQQQAQRPERERREGGQQNPSDGPPPMQQRRGDRRFVYRGPGPHAGDWLRGHEDEPVDQQVKQLENDPKFKQLPAERQQQLRDRLYRFNSMPPQQRDRVLNNLDIIEHMSPQQQQRARSMFNDLRQLPRDRQRALSGAFQQLRDMGPEDRQRTIDSDDFRKNYSDKERDILRGMTDLGLNPRGPQD